MYTKTFDFAEKQKLLSHITDCLSGLTGVRGEELFVGLTVLEVGGSGGILAGLLSNICSRIICSDVIDQNEQYGGEFSKLLREKFQRNGYSIHPEKIEFHKVDAQNLIYRDELFDAVISQNAFEHIPDPGRALRECLRVLKPGGLLFITFDPVWTADSGSHFLHRVGEPWLQLIASDEDFVERMRSNGASEPEVNSFLNDMNRLPVSYHREILPAILGEACSPFEIQSWSGCVEASHEKHPNRSAAAQNHKLTPEDLMVRGFRCFGCKKLQVA